MNNLYPIDFLVFYPKLLLLHCRFKVYDWMHVIKHGGLPQVMDSEEYDAAPSMEGLLVFLATLIGVRTNLC